MASIKSFPNNQNVYIGAEDVMKWLHGRTSGVFAAENNVAVAAVQGEMAVTVSDGIGWLSNAGKDGIVWWNDHEASNGSKLKLSIDPADSVLHRVDRIIVEWKTTDYVDLPEIKVLKGVTASTPFVHPLGNTSTVRQISLAMINIPAGTTAITASLIVDERLNPDACGIVTESATADTSMINAQYQELLQHIKDNLQQVLDGQIADGAITMEKLSPEVAESVAAAENALSLAGIEDEAHTIPENADLSEYTTIGAYRCSTAANAATLENAPPYTLSGFRLIVSATSRGDGFIQTAIFNTPSSARIYWRIRNHNEVWSSWYRVVGHTVGLNEELWSGSWESGSITVPNTSEYKMFLIALDGVGTLIPAFKHNEYIRGVGGYSTSAPSVSTYQFAASFSGNKWTLAACNSLTHNNGGNHGSATSRTVSSIIGFL